MMVLYIHKDLTDDIDNIKIAQDFMNANESRMNKLLLLKTVYIFHGKCSFAALSVHFFCVGPNFQIFSSAYDYFT